MKPPIRMVCGDCLQSVELNIDLRADAPVHCPICGGTIDSVLSELETPTSEFIGTLAKDDAPDPDGPTPWTETWSKGTLGTMGRFQLRELLGDGGFGQVYQAYDPRLDRDVALKVLKQPNPGERVMQRFFREARAAALLRHPSIVGIFDAGRDEGRCWIAYQFIKGRNLSRLRDQNPIDVDGAVRITTALADALDHAHRNGVFHRDLKPANVIIDDEGRPFLTDFGLARRADLDSDLTRDGTIIGTPAYMSPEQASGRSAQADERSDVYSLGVILFELLTGRRPANLPTEAPVWLAKAGTPPPPPRSINPAIPPELDRICMKALALRPENRYPNARSLAEDLGRLSVRRETPAWLRSTLSGVTIGLVAGALAMFGWAKLPVRAQGAGEAVPGIEAHAAAPKSETRDVVAELATHRAAEAIPPAPNTPVWPIEPAAASHLIGNRKSKSYHRSTCVTLHSMSSSNRIDFLDVAAAQGAMYSPCRTCKPPSGEDDRTGSAVKPAD